MASEMIERVAKAICAALSDEPWEELGPHWHGVYQTEARAAIEAMREPTDAILDAIDRSHQFPGPMWRAGIDAALGKVEE